MTVVNDSRARFAGLGIVVTGAAGGIGRAVCRAFAEEGGRVVGMDLHGADLTVDVADAEAVGAAVTEAHRRLGRIDVLVTLAGGSLGTPRDTGDITPADVDLVLDVNVKGTYHACAAALPFLTATGGCIVTCGSIGGRQPSPVTGVPYAAAKAAVGGLTRRLAATAGPDGVRVNAVAPGLFPTPRVAAMFDALPANEREAVIAAIPLRRMPELSELVAPILFLASRDAAYITGVTLDVNGGRHMPP